MHSLIDQQRFKKQQRYHWSGLVVIILNHVSQVQKQAFFKSRCSTKNSQENNYAGVSF